MTDQIEAEYSVCRLCHSTVDEKDTVIVNDNLREMLQTVLMRINLSVGENPVICSKCLIKLETNYNFKKRCIFTEESLLPFVVENVKIDLKEIRSLIIKSEETDNDKHVCRLCLQFIENNMTLCDSEKKQFQNFFPEINLLCTNFVILCSACYDFLNAYFIFVTSCLKLEQQLSSSSLDQIEAEINIVKEKIDIKNFQNSIKSPKEEEDGDLFKEEYTNLLNEELDIKCDPEKDDEQYSLNDQEVQTLVRINKEETNCNKNEQRTIAAKSQLVRTGRTSNHESDIQGCKIIKKETFKCEHCKQRFMKKCYLKRHLLAAHPQNIWYECEYCNKKFKSKQLFEGHQLTAHTEFSKIITHQCTDFQCTGSQFYWYQCKKCDENFDQLHDLKNHILVVHTDNSEITDIRVNIMRSLLSEYLMYNCKQCHRQFGLPNAYIA